MPIYEFYCSHCHRIYSFLSRAVDTERSPECPRCGAQGLDRRASAFAISKGRAERAEGEGLPDIDEGRMMKLMEELAPEADKLDENDPRQAARMMRRLFETAGLPVGSGMEEALRRMESGEDPEQIEQELGDALEVDPFAAGEAKPKWTGLKRRLLPPTVDPHLYEL